MPVHPEVAERFSILDGAESMRQFTTDPAFQERFKDYRSWPAAAPPPAVETIDLSVPGPHGSVPVRAYGDRSSQTKRPVLVWFHGGGFIGGDLEMREADGTAREISERADAVVVSVDYRLAQGDVCYPVPLDDCTAAVRWVLENADTLGIDSERAFLGGASAGANLATATTLRLRDEDGWRPAGLIPAYGIFHPRLPAASSSMLRLLDELPPILRFTPEETASMNQNYLGGTTSSSDGYAMPALADLDGLCSVILINAEYDALRSSGEAFAAALAVASVDVRQVAVPGMTHGFLNLPSCLEPVSAALDLMASVIRATQPSPHG